MKRRTYDGVGILDRLPLQVYQRQLSAALRERLICFQQPRCYGVRDYSKSGAVEGQAGVLGNYARMPETQPVLKKNYVEAPILKLLVDLHRLPHPRGADLCL